MNSSALDSTDPVAVAQALIRCPSVTPAEGGALDVLENILTSLGFTCTRLPFTEDGTPDVDNLYAEWGNGKPHFCFAGHTDVVPPGDAESWQHDPFDAVIADDKLYGRGASDMKGGIAAFVAAAAEFIAAQDGQTSGKISLLITGDEEGPALNGTKKMLQWLESKNKIPDHCLVGEPTNPTTLGEMMKVGRRGSMTGRLSVQGTQGHVAYPHLADNPVPKLIKLLSALDVLILDEGSEFFQPSNLEIVTIDVGNPADNVIPEKATAKFNIRFNDLHSGESLTKLLHDTLTATDIPYQLDISISGESFLTGENSLTAIIAEAANETTGNTPEKSTTGGTSDARFIANYCPVIEFGAVGESMHKIDEHIRLQDLRNLKSIYLNILHKYF
ncbi:MAG: succinyl-diaminopimelate desuccinylase [Pseudomonadota bacterium]|nr:succinyl-diaminopimelate desuccinylase [Pseudomonadota bacterium]QKK05517.1 MAG: succinyl-diaminopimelate desuccinylase [Pseudomonadota bacterium]